VNVDSLYKGPIERAPRKFSKMVIPPKLVEKLPFASRPKALEAPKSKKGTGYLARRKDPSSGLAPREDPEARAARKLVHQLSAVRNDKKRTRKEAKEGKKRERAREHAKIEASKKASSAAKNKAGYRAYGKDQARKRAKFADG